MRSTNPWCASSMILVMRAQQPPGSHVSHAESGVRRNAIGTAGKYAVS